MITEDEYLKKRDQKAPLSAIMRHNMQVLLKVVNQFLAHYKGVYYGVSSGYRPEFINKGVQGAAKKSAHLTCEAVDLRDPDGKLARWCLENIELLIKLDLYLESPTKTPGWVHLQTRPTKSGNRVFQP